MIQMFVQNMEFVNRMIHVFVTQTTRQRTVLYQSVMDLAGAMHVQETESVQVQEQTPLSVYVIVDTLVMTVKYLCVLGLVDQMHAKEEESVHHRTSANAIKTIRV
jgi:hypothetical protein